MWECTLQKQYREALNGCRKCVKADKCAYWKANAVALEADFAANRVHAAYKRVGLRDELDKVQLLAAGKLRRSDSSHTSNAKGESRHLQAALPGVVELSQACAASSAHTSAEWSSRPFIKIYQIGFQTLASTCNRVFNACKNSSESHDSQAGGLYMCVVYPDIGQRSCTRLMVHFMSLRSWTALY